jgi:hypothetical protein
MPHGQARKENREKKEGDNTHSAEWAEQQLKNAPPRSEQWVKEVARIWRLETSDSEDDDSGKKAS